MPPIRREPLKSITLSSKEREMIWLALTYRANLIETSNPMLSANDISEGHDGKVNPLDVEQMKTLIFIDDLKRKINATD